MEATGPNAEQIEYWNKQGGPQWVAQVARMDALIEPLGTAAQERAQVRKGERVLDVGCGTGQTTLQLAARVGPSGSVLGVDISTPMLELARERAKKEGLTNVRFENSDAQTHSLPPGAFDLCYSRFGVMFFLDPVAAFTNLARALRPGGRLAFVCWQPMMQNAWVREPMMAVAKSMPLPPPPPPDAPGPFAFGDAARTRGILERAGFSDVALEAKTGELSLGANSEEASRFVTEIGPVSRLLRDAPEAARKTASAAIAELVASRATPKGVSLGYAVWIATAARR
jgi:SAM-dependent methyltransferase